MQEEANGRYPKPPEFGAATCRLFECARLVAITLGGGQDQHRQPTASVNNFPCSIIPLHQTTREISVEVREGADITRLPGRTAATHIADVVLADGFRHVILGGAATHERRK
jgi:hypothetical protein